MAQSVAQSSPNPSSNGENSGDNTFLSTKNPQLNSQDIPQPRVLPSLLLGTYTPKVDSKGRVALPAKIRTELTDGFVLARGQEHCVYLLPSSEFRRMAVRIQEASVGDKATRDYLRVFLSGAVEETTDKQGRVVIPQMLRDYAKLGDNVVIIGVGTRAEIWNKEEWEKYLAHNEESYSEIANDVLPKVEF